MSETEKDQMDKHDISPLDVALELDPSVVSEDLFFDGLSQVFMTKKCLKLKIHFLKKCTPGNSTLTTFF